tara:strand:+ start:4801 stop:5076 length:276 start_codon:yes stop_codon:yes gene_type:complete
MIVDTKHGQFACNEITRAERRKLFKKIKVVYRSDDLSQLHDLADEFALIAFGDEKNIEEQLKNLTVVQEDEVLNEIIASYMGLELGKELGD